MAIGTIDTDFKSRITECRKMIDMAKTKKFNGVRAAKQQMKSLAKLFADLPEEEVYNQLESIPDRLRQKIAERGVSEVGAFSSPVSNKKIVKTKKEHSKSSSKSCHKKSIAKKKATPKKASGKRSSVKSVKKKSSSKKAKRKDR